MFLVDFGIHLQQFRSPETVNTFDNRSDLGHTSFDGVFSQRVFGRHNKGLVDVNSS